MADQDDESLRLFKSVAGDPLHWVSQSDALKAAADVVWAKEAEYQRAEQNRWLLHMKAGPLIPPSSTATPGPVTVGSLRPPGSLPLMFPYVLLAGLAIENALK